MRKLWKCACGRVHSEVGIEDAPKDPEMLARYTRCVKCGAPASSFVPAKPGDLPPLANLSPVVMPKRQP